MNSPIRATTETPLLETQEGVQTASDSGEPIRLLLIEDDYDSFRVADRRLSRSSLADFEVSWAASLPDGLTELAKGEFDAIVLDLALPGSEGIATIAGITAIAREIPILVLTGSDSEQLALAAKRSGVARYLVKTEQSRESLAHAVLEALGRKHDQGA